MIRSAKEFDRDQTLEKLTEVRRLVDAAIESIKAGQMMDHPNANFPTSLIAVMNDRFGIIEFPTAYQRAPIAHDAMRAIAIDIIREGLPEYFSSTFTRMIFEHIDTFGLPPRETRS